MERRKRARKDISLPRPTAAPKYGSNPHPLLKLDRKSLPSEISNDLFNKAVANFSASISNSTHKVYSTTAKHILEAERLLGRDFSCPPSDQEQLFFLTYLQGKPLKADTVSNYMSAFRWVCKFSLWYEYFVAHGNIAARYIVWH